MNKVNVVFIVILGFIVVGCQPKVAQDQKPIVTVSILPQKFFVDQIAGDWLYVNVMVPPGGNPHTYEPTPQQMIALSESSAYLRIGQITFETAWMDKLTSVSPHMKVFDTSDSIVHLADEPLCDHDESAHNSDHHYHAYNPHIWLSPSLVKIQSKNIYEALVALYPDKKPEMEQNLNRFLLQCDSVHQQLDKQLSLASQKSFIVYHPVWTYLAEEYGLQQIAIEENGKEATADGLKYIIDFATENKIHIVFVQREFSNAQARTIAAQIKGKVITMNPLDYNWFTTMHEFGEAFAGLNQ